MNKEQLEKEKNSFLNELGLTQERADLISNEIKQMYDNDNEKETIIQLMFKARDLAKTGSEDIFVCYLVGFFHAERMFSMPTVLIQM